MRTKAKRIAAILLTSVWLAAGLPAIAASGSEIPQGTRFLVELRDKLDATKIQAGKKFEANTLEALQGSDGKMIKAGAKLRGIVTHVERSKMVLRFDRIDTGRGWVPIAATVTQVIGEHNVKEKAGSEGEVSASGGRGKRAAIGAAVGAGVGAAIGASEGGGKGAAIGAGAGGAGGAVIGAASGGHSLVLEKGARLELALDRPLNFRSR